MPIFNYKVRDATGHVEEGSKEGGDRYVLAREFTASGKTVISIEEKKKESSFDMDKINAKLTPVKMQEKIVFARNLASMLDAGLALARALNVLEKQTENFKLKETIKDLGGQIAQGTSMSDAMKKHEKVFSKLFVSMVHAGEESGNLADSLRVVGDQLDKSYQLKKKIKGAMLYPSIVISAMIIIGILMFIYVVPTLTATFESLNADLPTSTRVVIFVSDMLKNHPLTLVGIFIGLIILGVFFARSKQGKRIFEKIVLHLPVIAKLAKETNAASTTRALASLLSSGVDMVASLEITRDIIQNSHYKEVLVKAKENVEKGIPLSEVFVSRTDLYPVLVGEMVQVGEETGKLSDMLLNTAVFYEAEVEEATKDLSTIIEPVLMIIIGGGVGFFAVSMLTPMYTVMNNI